MEAKRPLTASKANAKKKTPSQKIEDSIQLIAHISDSVRNDNNYCLSTQQNDIKPMSSTLNH